MDIETLLLELGHQFAIEALALEDDACALRFEDGVQVELHYLRQEDALCLACPVGPWVGSEKAGLFKWLLNQNATGQDLEGHCFAVDALGAGLVLCGSDTGAARTPDSVYERIVKLGSQQQYWRERLTGMGWLLP